MTRVPPPRTSAQLETALDTATHAALFELARLLVSAGYGFGAFAQHAKQAFVEAAGEVLARQGTRLNRSMIAASTGLTRGEVAALLRTKQRMPHSSRRISRAARLAAAWRSDQAFRGRSLAIKSAQPSAGKATIAPTFDELVRLHGGDIPPRAMQAELLRSGLAEKTRDGRLKLSSASRDHVQRAVQAMEATLPWLQVVTPQVIDPHPGEPISSSKTVAALAFANERELFAALDRVLERSGTLVDGFKARAAGPRAPGELIVGIAIAGSRPPRAAAKTTRPPAKRR